MTRKEAERLTRQAEVLLSLGFSSEEAEQLRRISMTLQRWHELECGTDNGCIEREGEDGSGKPFWRYSDGRKGACMADREAGARKRLAAIIKRVNVQRAGKVGPLSAYVQTDPRGAALYILRPGDVPQGQDVGAHYNRGICVY
jgi:hypothetical protein